MSAKNISITIAASLVAVLVYWFGLRGEDTPKPKPVAVATPAPKAAPTVMPAPKAESQGKSGQRNLEVHYEDDPAGNLRLEGQVITPEDDPVAGAMVAIDSRPPRFVKTAEDGSFFFDKLVSRNYDLVAQSEEGAAGPVTARLSETNDPVILTLREGGSVRVLVSRGDGGAPVEGAEVQLRGISVQTAQSDAQGVALFSQVPVSRYEVVAGAPGFAPERTPLVVSRSGATAELSLVLKAGAKVSGVVLDAEGAPVSGARVVYQGASDWSVRADRRLDHVLSGGDGRFEIEALPKGSFRFVADAEGHAQGTSEVVSLDGTSEASDVEIRMEASAILRGRVLGANGAPVATARVRVSAKSAGAVRRGGAVRQAYTDEEGRYEIGELRRRAHEVMALHETASSEIVGADLSKAPHEMTLDINLSIEGVVAGIVVDTQGEPIAGAQVSLVPDFGKGSSRSASEWRMRGIDTELTDAGGLFRMTGIAADKDFRVRAVPGTSTSPGRAWLSEGVEARTGDENVRVVLPADGGIRGKVLLANGEAPSLFTVSVGWQRGTPFSSKDGKFELSDLPPETFTVVIGGPEIDEHRVVDVVVKEGAYTDIGSITAIQGRKVTGTVVDQSGSPVAGAKVSAGRTIFGDGSSAVASGQGRNPMARATKTVDTDAQGGFAIRGVVTGDISVVADHETVGRSAPVALRQSNESLEGITLQLQATGALGGLVSKDGKPEDGVVVIATSVSYPGVTFNVASGADGTYRFDRLIADTYRIKAMFGGNPMVGMSFFAKQTTVVAESINKLDINFNEGGAKIRVVLSAEGGLGFTWLSLVGEGVQVTTARDLQAAQGSAIGYEAAAMSIRGSETSIRNVPAGTYQLCALVYPTEVSGMSDTMAYGEREGDNLLAQCQKVSVAEGAEELTVDLPVLVPEYIPGPNEAATTPSDETAPE